MASTFTDLGLEIMATGENAGTWGDKTNTNLNIVNTAIAGYVEQSIAGGAATTTLTITDGAATSVAQNAVIKLTGSITGNQIVTIPNSIEKVYIITNGTSGAFTVQVKTVSGSGVTFGVSEKTTKLLYSDGTNIVDAGFSGGLDIEGRELVLDADGDTSLTADTDDQIDIRIAGTDQLTIKDGALSPVTTNDIDLGTASLEFKNAFFDGTVTSDAFAGPLTGNVTGNASGTAATVTGAAQSSITSLGTLTTLTVDDITINGSTISDAGDFTLDVEGDIILDANGADVFLKDAGTTYGSLTNTSGNLIVKSGTTTALTFSGANVTVAGDLTVSGDDITMGTNTAGNLLIADGTNFNSVAVSSLSEISTAASGDLLLAVDASGGGLKKITRSAVIAGTGSSGDLANVVEDTSPQLGGNLDMNGADIITTSNATIDLAPNGTGTVVVRGNTNSGAIVFNCESNSHGQKVIAQPHSASVTNVMLLPAGADSTLVSLVSADTLTNKTLTAPKIADGGFIADANGNQLIVFQTTGSAVNELEITNNAAGSNPILAATGGDTNIGIALTPKGTGEIVIGAANLNYAGTAVTSTGAELNLVDGITAGTVSASLAVIADSNKDISGFRNVTLTGEVDAATGDFSGAVDIAGQLTVADGSAGAPAISNTGDANTGLLFSAADTLAFSAGGTAQFTMADGGIIPVTTNDVDLGTASLQFKNVFVDGTTFTDALGFGTVVMTLPTADGDANQILTTDGSGTLAFVDNSGGTDWQAVKTGNFTAAAGQGVFANTTSAAFTVTLPAGSIGDEISIIDYAGTFDSNALTVAANGSEKIHGSTDDLTISVERAALTLVFTDGTQGWLVRG